MPICIYCILTYVLCVPIYTWAVPTTFETLTVNNAAGLTIITAITVNDALSLTKGNLNVGATTLSINGDLSKTSGFINAIALSSLSFGGTAALSLASDLFYTTPSVNNLTINRSGGVVFGSDLTITGELNLQSANPASGIIGSLHMGTDTLRMGATATTVGHGDVTGIVKRTTILANIEYTFGNEFTSITFPDIGTLPTEVAVKISVGTAPSWKPDAVKRIYELIHVGGSDTRAILKGHYLDGELNGNIEEDLSDLTYIFALDSIIERGRSDINTVENWVFLRNLDFDKVPANFGVMELALSESDSDIITWDGSISTDWNEASNWIPAFSPDVTRILVVPDATTTLYDPLLPDSDSIYSLLINSGGILNSGTNSELTIIASGGAWSNNGTFNASTGKVIFKHGEVSNIVTLAGETDFYTIEVGENTTIQPVSGSTVRIAGQIEVSTTSVIDFSNVNTTVEWNGADQSIFYPNGIAGNSGYYNLILSGSGTKIMPASALIIGADLSTSGTVKASAADSLLINGNLTIGTGSTFESGSFNHILGGNFENNGTFTAGARGNIIFNGTAVQSISGSSTTDFDKLTIENTQGLTQLSTVNITTILNLNNGSLSVENTTLGINGTINNPSGTLNVNSTSSISFGGASAIVLNNNLFNGNATLNNFTINRSGGVSLGNESITVAGTLSLTSGTLTIAANTLTLAGSSPILTSGNINAGHAFATLLFDNSAAITLPHSIFEGNVNNLTINGTGGVSSDSDITINNVLKLSSNNPSSIKGSLDMGTDTLHMAANATTKGVGDVTGILKREHVFANGIDYSFGSEYTTLNFLNVPGSSKPTWISCKVEIGVAPTWRSEAINRFYSFAQSGGNDRMIVKLHYLDSELHGDETDEAKLVFWDAYNPDLLTPNSFTHFFPRNHNGVNSTNNWVQLTGPAINYLATSSVLDVKQWGLGYSSVSIHQWIGLGSPSYPGDWSLPGHWDGGVPQAGDDVLIPADLPEGNSGYPYRNLLPVIAPASAKSIEIEQRATLNSSDYTITVSGSGDAWVNNGLFLPGTGTVTFDHGDDSVAVNINGSTNFYNLYIDDKTFIKAASNSTTKIAGTFSMQSSSIVDFVSNTNTVEYNGAETQVVLNPATETSASYHHLILSGAGTKTLPALSPFTILGDFTSNAEFAYSGASLVMNGVAAQSISGTVAPLFNDFTNSNTAALLTVSVDVDCSGEFTNAGLLDMTNANLRITGAVLNSGTVKTASTSTAPLPSGKNWGGSVQYYAATGAQTVMAGTYDNLSLINTSGTQSASGSLIVNGALTTATGSSLNMGSHQLLGTLSTIANGGSILTQNTSTTPIPTGKIWGGIVQYNAISGGQTAMAGTYSTLTMGNTSGTQTASGAIVATTLNTSAGGVFHMSTYVLSGLATVSNLGTFRTQNTSSTPFTSGLSWGGTVAFDGTSAQTIPSVASTFTNLSISNTAGVTSAAHQTVNGILNLSVANPDATHGSLDMATYTLNMGASATTTGVGDVTGIITRTSFVVNTTYSYGNANQYVLFPDVAGQTLPSSFSLRITLLTTAPDWVAASTKRLYEMAQTGGVNTKATFRANYLDTELPSGVDESVLSFWQNNFPFDASDVVERGWSDYNSQENWITFSDANFENIPSVFGYIKFAIASTQVEYRTWNGSQSNSAWNTATNWTPQGIPTASLGIVIPDVDSSNAYSPDLAIDAAGKYLIIQNGGILNAATNAKLTLYGNGNVWSTEAGGNFNAGNSNVVFAGDTLGGAMRISGETDFYDITVADSSTLRPGVNAYIGITGLLTNNGILDAATNHNTIEYKKDASFTIPNPNGTNPGYHTLKISGSGTKTLPATTLNIWHNFINNGTVAAGTGSVTFNGLHSSQIIGGDSSTAFYNLTIANTGWEITTEANITVNNILTIDSSAVLNPGAMNTIGGSGTLTGSGMLMVTGLSEINSLCTQCPIVTKNLSNLTVDYNAVGDQVVCAENYGNLVISANGNRTVTLADTGIIGIAGFFNPDLTATTYTITGSTIEANGTGAQTVPAFDYYNVSVTGDRGGETVALVNGGTIGIAGHGSITATNVNYDITNNTIDINGSGNQNLDNFSFYYLKISNSGIKTALDTLTVYAGITIDTGLTLDMASAVLMGPMGTIRNSGTIKTANTSAAPLPSGKTWGGFIEYAGDDSQTLVAGTFNNLTMSGAGGGSLEGDITVNGALNLSHANPLATQGILHTGTDTLFMGELATTVGIGDVTGIVKRHHPFADSVEYTFGNQYTNLNFLDVEASTKPIWITCKISIGAAPIWRSEAINRNYSFAQSGGTDRMIVKLHYLDSELHGSETDESQLVFWDAYNPDLVTPNSFTHFYPRNKSGSDGTNNWIQLSGPAINYLATSSALDVKQWGLGYSNVDTITWIGLGSPSYPGDWSLPGHWNGGVPGANDDVLITGTLPEGSSGYPYKNLLPLISPSTVKTLEIETGATLTLNDFDITISGDANAWINNGTFNPGTSAVIFNNGNTSNAATLAGSTNFYDINVSANTKIQAATGTVVSIGGDLNLGAGSILDFSSKVNTVVYNGNNAQSVLNPMGGSSPGYHHLILRASGTKTLPSTLNVLGDYTINANTVYSGNTTVMSGSTFQTIKGSSTTTFNNLSIDNSAGVSLNMDQLCTVRGILQINSGKKLEVAAGSQFTVSGTISNNAGSAGFVLRSSDLGTASLIHETDDVPATVERTITGDAEDWHFLSTPVVGQEIAPAVASNPSWVPSGTYGNGTGYDMYLWNEPGHCWIYKLDADWNTLNSGTDFAKGRGYLYSVQATSPTKEFAGTLNNGELTYALTIEGSADLSLQGFNLVGNPYPSSIDWMAPSGWTRDKLVTSGSQSGNDMWIWNPAAGNYGVCNSETGDGTNAVTRYIAPMQGFFVRAESAGDLVSTNNVRVHDATNLWKSASIEPSRIAAVVYSESDQTFDEVRLLFGYPENSAGVAKLFSPLTTAPSLYLPSANAEFSIRYLSDTISNSKVPLWFKAGSDGDYTLEFNFNTRDFETVILEDKLTKQFIDLTSASDYRFIASQTDSENRFLLHFKAVAPEKMDLPARIYSSDGKVVLDLTLVDGVTDVKIVDVLGRMILQKSVGGNSIHRLELNTPSQIFIVFAKAKQGVISRKLFVN